jgi:hypothetical protein
MKTTIAIIVAVVMPFGFIVLAGILINRFVSHRRQVRATVVEASLAS